MIQNNLVGDWVYRSFVSDPTLSTEFSNLEFGRGKLSIIDAPFGVFKGTLGDTGWSLDLNGSINFGDPFTIRFQGKGTVGGEEWIYDYSGYIIKPWPNGIDQVPVIVGSIVRTIPHSNGTAKAGVVASWIAVYQGAK